MFATLPAIANRLKQIQTPMIRKVSILLDRNTLNQYDPMTDAPALFVCYRGGNPPTDSAQGHFAEVPIKIGVIVAIKYRTTDGDFSELATDSDAYFDAVMNAISGYQISHRYSPLLMSGLPSPFGVGGLALPEIEFLTKYVWRKL